MSKPSVAILHYSAPPVIGGVEAVIHAHCHVLNEAGYPVTVIAGRGSKDALPTGTEYIEIPLIDSQHSEILQATKVLETGFIPENFPALVTQIKDQLTSLMVDFDVVFIHNVLTKHFNLPLTTALVNMIDRGQINQPFAWTHDISWTSTHSRSQVFPGYPWDLLRTLQPNCRYVTVSEARQSELVDLFGIQPKDIQIIYNGVDPNALLGLSEQGRMLADHFNLWRSDIIILLPVRITRAKNIEFAIQFIAALKRSGFQPRMVITGPPDPHDINSTDYFTQLLEMRREYDVEQELCFVFQAGPDPNSSLKIDSATVGDLYRISDLLFLPSHREGFGMPVLEAGLAGIPVVTTAVPASVEIGGEDVLIFAETTDPVFLAEQVLAWMQENPVFQFRRRVRSEFTWQAIFENQIKPLITFSKTDNV